MKAIAELDMNNPNEQRALRTVLQKVTAGKVVASIKQAVKKGDDYSIRMVQTVVTEMGALISKDGEFIYFTIRDLKRHNVKQVQTLWKTVLRRGMNQFENGEANDYVLTVDCVYIDEDKAKIFSFGSHRTPLFCSSDGDDDLTLVVPAESCYISIDNYDAKELAYEAEKGKEKGEKVTPLTTTKYKEEAPEKKKKEQSEEYIKLMEKINNGINVSEE